MIPVFFGFLYNVKVNLIMHPDKNVPQADVVFQVLFIVFLIRSIHPGVQAELRIPGIFDMASQGHDGKIKCIDKHLSQRGDQHHSHDQSKKYFVMVAHREFPAIYFVV